MRQLDELRWVFVTFLKERADSTSHIDALKESGQHGLLTRVLTLGFGQDRTYEDHGGVEWSFTHSKS